MARQKKGVINLDGKAGTLSFFQGRDGYGARISEGIKGERILDDKGYARTRENAAEFGRAGKAGKLFRGAFRPLSLSLGDRRLTARTTQTMMKVVQSDPVNDRGMRNAAAGDSKLLIGFEFNAGRPLVQSFLQQFTATIDRAAGKGSIALSSYSPATMIAEPPGATHYQFLVGLAALDFTAQASVQALLSTEPLPLGNRAVDANVLSVTLPEVPEDPMFLVFGIMFVQIVNQKAYAFNDAGHSALSVVAVDDL